MIVSNADIGRRMTPSNSEERMDVLDDQKTASVAHMGIAAGFCNVGNFGGADCRETCAPVCDMVAAQALAPSSMRGISREMVSCAFDGMTGRDRATTTEAGFEPNALAPAIPDAVPDSSRRKCR